MLRSLMALTLLLVPAWTVRADDAPQDALALRRTPVVAAVEKVRHAVVNISTERVVVRRGRGPFMGPGADLFDRMFDDFFSERAPVQRSKVQQPLGSGCIITPDGLVLTNEHVIRRASNLMLSLDSGETFEAEVLAADPDEDLALLRAKAPHPLSAIPMGDSSDLLLGETVIALGNPLGFENSITTGIVSALNREITVGSGDQQVQFKELIQTSALINPGNSGGPLVNVLGQLIGVNAAVVDQAQGIGFAIPIARAREKLAPLLAARKVSKAWAGIKGETAPGRTGARLTEVDPKGPAQGRLQPEDVVVRAAGRPVRDLFDLALTIVGSAPQERLELSIRRGGVERTVTLELAEPPEPPWEEALASRCGVAGTDLTRALARRQGLWVAEGVLLTRVTPEGPADRAGLQPGDVIIQMGAHPVRNLRDAAEALAEAPTGSRLVVVVVRGNVKGYTRITLPGPATI